MDRRAFFRQLMLRGLDRAEQAGKEVGKRYKQLEENLQRKPADADAQPPEPAVPKPVRAVAKIDRFLRPPGALPEADFLQKCTSCGQCAAACPADAILIDPDQASGKPFIHARAAPCVMCLDLSCMTACPSGALQRVSSPMEIRIGVAKIDHSRCLRTPAMTVARGAPLTAEDCTVCVTQCPAGESALAINEEGDLEVRPGCTGCGVCERACPTEPASILVIPNPR